MVYTYRTAETLGSTASAVWAFGMLIPIVNLIVFFALSIEVSRACKSNGVSFLWKT